MIDSGIRTAAAAAARTTRLFGDDIFKGSPGNDRKEEVVEREKAEVAARAVADARADAADDDRDRERQEEEREEQLPGAAGDCHRGEERPDRADPDVRKGDAGDRR